MNKLAPEFISELVRSMHAFPLLFSYDVKFSSPVDLDKDLLISYNSIQHKPDFNDPQKEAV